MPRAKPLAKFSPEYSVLLEAVYAARSLDVATPNPSAAATLKSNFYAYTRALEREAPDSRLARIGSQLTASISRSTPATVHFSRKSDTWDNVAIRQALGLKLDADYTTDGQEIPPAEEPSYTPPLGGKIGIRLSTPAERLAAIRADKEGK